MTAPLWSVFTKPWPDLDGGRLGLLVAGLGFTGVEIPVRDGFFLTPANAGSELPRFTRGLADSGVAPASIASGLDEATFAACAAAKVPLIRVMAEVHGGRYAESAASFRQQLEQAAGHAAQYGVAVGVQPHHGDYVSSAVGVMALLDGLPEKDFGVVWDAAHDALTGCEPAMTLGLVKDRLAMVNLKNVLYSRHGGSAPVAEWETVYVDGGSGLARWDLVLAELAALDLTVPVCLSAQYSHSSQPVEELAAADLLLARTLWDSGTR